MPEFDVIAVVFLYFDMTGLSISVQIFFVLRAQVDLLTQARFCAAAPSEQRQLRKIFNSPGLFSNPLTENVKIRP